MKKNRSKTERRGGRRNTEKTKNEEKLIKKKLRGRNVMSEEEEGIRERKKGRSHGKKREGEETQSR